MALNKINMCVEPLAWAKSKESFMALVGQALCAINASINESDAEYIVFQDETGGGVIYFIRAIVVDQDGNKTVADFELDASTPYTVLGTESPVGGLDAEYLLLQDDNGPITYFIRAITFGLDGSKTVLNFELDGTTTYVPTGTITPVLSTGGGGATPVAAVFEPLATLGFAAVLVAYAVLISPSADLKYLEIFNATDQPIIVSFTAGAADHWRIGIQEGRTYEFNDLTSFQAADISIKRAGAAPLSGEVRAMGWS